MHLHTNDMSCIVHIIQCPGERKTEIDKMKYMFNAQYFSEIDGTVAITDVNNFVSIVNIMGL